MCSKEQNNASMNPKDCKEIERIPTLLFLIRGDGDRMKRHKTEKDEGLQAEESVQQDVGEVGS